MSERWRWRLCWWAVTAVALLALVLGASLACAMVAATSFQSLVACCVVGVLAGSAVGKILANEEIVRFGLDDDGRGGR
jgi:hypothetical protein